jgi:FAD/FMN-containing dehydrogenase
MAWANWSGAQVFPEAHCEPLGTEAALQARLRAAPRGQRFRAVGAGHSFSPLWGAGDQLLSLDAFDGVAEAGGQLWLGAGQRLADLGPKLAGRGLALANQGDIDRQSLAGALGTGTHGTGWALPSLAATVTGLRLIDGTGTLQVLSDPDVLAGARIHLGALGLITAVALRLRPAYGLLERNQGVPFEALFEGQHARLRAQRHGEFWWVPATDETLFKQLREIPIPRTARLTPLAFGEEGTRWGPSWAVFPSDRSARFNEMEYSVPVAAGPACFRALRSAILSTFPKLPWPVEYRLVAGDEGWLSPTGGQRVAAISVHQDARRPFAPLFDLVEPIFKAHGGRPHWGKRFSWSRQEFEAAYGAGLDRFRTLRARLDPEGRFLTAGLAPLFGAPNHA